MNASPLTLTKMAIVVSAVFLILSFTFDLDLFERMARWLQKMEAYELDEFIIVALIIFPCLVIDVCVRRVKEKMKNAEKRIYQSMNYVSHHVINNFLNQANALRFEAEDHKNFDSNTLKMYDQSIEEAKSSLHKLSSLKRIDSENIRAAVLP